MQMAGCIVFGIAVAWWQGWRARRATTQLHEQGVSSLPARVTREGGRPRAGRVLLTAGQATWTARRGGTRIDLTGAHLLSVAEATGWQARFGDVVVRLSLHRGGTVEVRMDGDLADVLLDALLTPPAGDRAAPPLLEPPDDVPEPALRPPGRAWWGWALVGAAALWLAYCASMFLTGYSTTVTVTGGDGEGFCDVVWGDPSGRPQQGEADCADEPAGTTLDVRVTGWPDPGDPTTPGLFVTIALMFAVPAGAAGVARLGYLRSRRREWLLATSAPADTRAPAVMPLAALTEQDVHPGPGRAAVEVLTRLAPYAALQVPPSAWSRPDAPDGARTPVPASRFLARIWVPALVLAFVLALTWPWPYRWLVLQTSETAPVAATSTGRIATDPAGPFPGEVTVTFRLPDGTEQRADVTTGSDLPDGEQVRVRYAVESPRWARLDGEADDLDTGAAVAALASVATLGTAGWRVHTLARWRRRVRQAADTAPRPALGLLTADADGDPLLLLTDPLVVPTEFTAVPLARPLPHDAVTRLRPGTQLSVHGGLGHGAAVVVRVPGIEAPLLPTAPAVDLPPFVLLDLLDPAHAWARDQEEPDAPDPVDGHAH